MTALVTTTMPIGQVCSVQRISPWFQELTKLLQQLPDLVKCVNKPVTSKVKDLMMHILA